MLTKACLNERPCFDEGKHRELHNVEDILSDIGP